MNLSWCRALESAFTEIKLCKTGEENRREQRRERETSDKLANVITVPKLFHTSGLFEKLITFKHCWPLVSEYLEEQ